MPTDYSKRQIKSILRSIKSNEQNIIEHEEKLSDPEGYATDFDFSIPGARERLIRHWTHEIEVYKAEIKAAKEELERRDRHEI